MTTQALSVMGEISAPPIKRRQTRPLSHDKERGLQRRVGGQKDLAVRNKLVEENLSLVRWVVTHMFQWALQLFEYEDLVGYGNLGLITAAEKFDPSRGNRFSTLAVWWIYQQISRSVMNEGEVIRMPVYMHAVRDKVQKVTQRREIELKGVPTLQEIAEDTGVPKDQVILAFLYMQHHPVSLEQKTCDSEGDFSKTTIGNLVSDTTMANPELLMEAQQEFEAAKRRIDKLLANMASTGVSKRDIEIFKMFYCFDGSGSHRTLGAVGEKYKLTRERIRQVVRNAWQKVHLYDSEMNDEQLRKELVRIEELGKIATSVF